MSQDVIIYTFTFCSSTSPVYDVTLDHKAVTLHHLSPFVIVYALMREVIGEAISYL